MLDFFICGVQKGGTTSIHSYLRTHPDVFMPEKKELHFFDNDRLFETVVDYGKLHCYFGEAEQGKICGEATPIYSYWKPSAPRISKYNPKAKLIVSLRNPIDRAFSHWNMNCYLGLEKLSFLSALKAENERKKESKLDQDRNYSYVDRGFYSQQLKHLWKYFSTDQVLILPFDLLQRDASEFFRRIIRFLGLDPLQLSLDVYRGACEYETAMSDYERGFLRTVFEEEIQLLEELLDWNYLAWLD
jgi:hypothetical protein